MIDMMQVGYKLINRLFGRLFLLLCLLTSWQAAVASVVVISKDAALYQQVSASIRQIYDGPLHSITLNQLRNRTELIVSENDITVAVGVEATEYLMANLPISQQMISVFIPQSAFRTLWSRYQSRWKSNPRNISAVYLDQPLSRQLRLAKLVVPDLKRIGTALGPSTSQQLADLQSAASQAGVELVHTVVNSNDNPVRRLQPVIQHSDVFVPVPDSAVFNRTTAKWILYIAYRKRIPLIGFSRKYVEAGAVAAVHSTPEQLGKQAGELLKAYEGSDAELPLPQHPRYFTVSVNRVAARSLKMDLPSDLELLRRLEELED